MKISKNTLLWLYMVFALKLVSLAISAYASSRGWNWVPPASNPVLAVALAFVLSSLVFLSFIPKLGLASTATYGALTFYSAVTALATGQYLAWSATAAITGLALIGLVIQGWRELSNTKSIES